MEEGRGANRAYVETVPVEVTDGKFKITFTSNVENPQINAIEIIPQATGTPAAPTPAKEQGAIRIKAGSSAPFTDSAGNVWKAEEGFEGGSVIERPEIAIANTKDAGLYRSEHYSMDSFSCAVPNGKYTARLHFAETYEGITGEGQRVFSFNVQGHEFKDFDVWKKAGARTAPMSKRCRWKSPTASSRSPSPATSRIRRSTRSRFYRNRPQGRRRRLRLRRKPLRRPAGLAAVQPAVVRAAVVAVARRCHLDPRLPCRRRSPFRRHRLRSQSLHSPGAERPRQPA